MNDSILIHQVGVYQFTNNTLYGIIQDFLLHKYEYGLITNQYGEVEGYFTSVELLRYCHQIRFQQVKDTESSTFINVLKRDFEIVEDENSLDLTLPKEIQLYILKKEHHFSGVIERESYLDHIIQKQQLELRHFQTMFNAVPSGIIAVNIEGNITMMNPAAEKFSGVPKEKALGQFITDVVPPDGLLRVLQTGQGHVEKYKVRKWWYVSHREPIYDGKQLVGAVGVFEDISKMEMLSTELESVKQLVKENEALMEHNDYGIAVMDDNGNIIRQNRKFQQFYLSMMTETEQRMKLFQTIHEVIHSKTSQSFEEQSTHKGTTILIKFTPIVENGLLQSIIVQVIDITINKQKEVTINQLQKTVRSFSMLNQQEPYIYDCEEMHEIAEKIQKAAKVNAPVLITGEIGSGRSSLAKQIVQKSNRKLEIFLEIDCLGKSFHELENIIFGSRTNSNNIFQIAIGGTIYFKNIDYLPIPLQEQLADIINEQSTRLESSLNSKMFDVRLIASVSREFEFNGSNVFSERLFYLFNAISFTIPPFEKRHEEIKKIIHHFLKKLKEKVGVELSITEEALDFLIHKKWKRNIRDILECIEQFVVSYRQAVIQKEQLIRFLEDQQVEVKKAIVVNEIIPLKQAVVEVEKELIQLVSAQNISYRKMAKILEVNPSTIVRKVKNMK